MEEVENLKVGDLMRSFNTDTVQAVVVDVSDAGHGMIRLTVKIGASRGVAVTRSFDHNPFQRVRVKRTVPCGVPVCENHLRAVGPGIYHCERHWNQWSKVA